MNIIINDQVPGFGFGTSLGNGVFPACGIGSLNPNPPAGFLGGGRAGAKNKDSNSDLF